MPRQSTKFRLFNKKQMPTMRQVGGKGMNRYIDAEEIGQNYYLADIKQYVIVKCKDGIHRVFAEVSLDITDMVGEDIEVAGFYETHCQARFICDKRNEEVKE